MKIVPPGIPAGAIPIKDREAYLACPDGRIYSTVTNIFLKPHIGEDGRLRVAVPRLNRKPGEKKFTKVRVSTLICTTFHGERPDGLTVSHLNGNLQDNRPENLLWETLKENLERKREHGTMGEGFENSNAKLSPEHIVYIRAWRKQGRTLQEIAAALGVSFSTIHKILSGKRYPQEIEYDGEIPECPIIEHKVRFGSRGPSVRLTEDQVIAIRKDDRSYSTIAKDYGVSKRQIVRIKSRASWSHVGPV